jgi:hypothetical protein
MAPDASTPSAPPFTLKEKTMAVSAVSTSQTYQQTSSTTTDGMSRGRAMKALVDGINSGDLTSAKTAFDALEKDRQRGGAAASSTSGATTGTSQRDQDIAALGKALDSGDADAAKQALAKLRDDGKNAAGATQGAHPHHHGHKAQATTSGNDQDTPLTYGASASSTQTPAPGSTIDVSA